MGGEHFSLRIEAELPPGRYGAIALGTDTHGNHESPSPGNRARFRVG